MKKTLMLAVIAVAVISISCRKDRTCTCTSTITETDKTGTYSGTGSSTQTLKAVKKNQAKLNNCYDRTTTETFLYGTSPNIYSVVDVTVYKCTLK